MSDEKRSLNTQCDRGNVVQHLLATREGIFLGKRPGDERHRRPVRRSADLLAPAEK